jgi:hypothetical protein
VTQARAFHLLRERAGAARVTNVELTFDLVYVFAVTQLSHHLLHRPTLAGAPQTARDGGSCRPSRPSRAAAYTGTRGALLRYFR